jgi:JNK1/MAPK8-associated membrane protein
MNFEKCPGIYCGRMLLENGSLSECGACDRGFKRNETGHICSPCEETLSEYETLFLAFNSIVPLLIYLFLIDFTSKTPKK